MWNSLADGAQIVIGSDEQIRNGNYEHWFNIPMSANDFGRLTAKEFLAQLKQNLELRLNRYWIKKGTNNFSNICCMSTLFNNNRCSFV